MSAHTLPGVLRGFSPLSLACALVFAGALAAITAAFGFEYLGGYAPCPLCMQQRLAYHLAIPVALLAFLLSRADHQGLAALLLGLVAAAFLANAGLGVYHAGVEWKWWPGPTACAATGELSIDEGVSLLESLRQGRSVACDEAPWRFLSLSFAGWSAVISLCLGATASTGALSWHRSR
jgi:disulfide bond formation protein DsbB